MPWIDVIEEENADAELKAIYDEIKETRGKLSNIMKIHSLNPATMKDHMDMYMTIMFGKSGLSREEREMIGVVVSAANCCDYCINHHAMALDFYWRHEERLKAFIRDPFSIDLPARGKYIVEYAHDLTVSPSVVGKELVAMLKDAGHSDKDTLSLHLTVSYFNYVNRIVIGLDVEFSEEEMRGYKY